MNYLFDLYISLTEEECGKKYWTEHHIGTFTTKEKAIMVMKTVMSEGHPFSKPDCEPRIQEVELVGKFTNHDSVYRFSGYNTEGDMIRSPYYTDKPTAIQEFLKAKKNTPGRGWYLNTYKIG